jgi:minor extracellular protease Epr
MNIKVIYFILILIILLVIPSEAKPIIIGFKGYTDPTIIETYNITNYTLYKSIDAVSADVSELTYYKLKNDERIRFVENDTSVYIQKKDLQPIQEIDWGVYSVKAPNIWGERTGEGVKIAIIDTGISKTHPDLSVNGGINLLATSYSKKWDDDNGHGTYVAGIIGAGNNSIGVIGVAPNAELYAVKALDSNGKGNISDIIEGIEWSVQNDMDIVSMSFGSDTYSQALSDACSNAYDSGIILVAAAGNEGDGNSDTNEVVYPAKYDSVIAVSAIDCYNIAPSWSADGPEVELTAPGVNVYSTYLESKYTIESGTSAATPFVSGAAALLKSGNESINSQEIRNLLVENAFDLGDEGRDRIYGYGLVQAS